MNRPPALLTAALLLGATCVWAQGRPNPAARRAEPPASCVVSEFRALALDNHDLAERQHKARDWVQRNTPACNEDQLRLLSSNRSAWMGNADSLPLMAQIDGALEARLKNRPEQLARLFGATPPPKVAGDDTLRAGTLAPRPAPVVAGTPAVATTLIATAAPAAAAPPPGPGKPPEVGKHFDDKLRGAVREFFSANRGSGACPAGLVAKSGQCVSAVAERAWKIGQALPASLSPRELPSPLLEKLGPAPAGHSYVQLDGDLLLMATASRTVVDAVQDLGQVPPRS